VRSRHSTPRLRGALNADVLESDTRSGPRGRSRAHTAREGLAAGIDHACIDILDSRAAGDVVRRHRDRVEEAATIDARHGLGVLAGSSLTSASQFLDTLAEVKIDAARYPRMATV